MTKPSTGRTVEIWTYMLTQGGFWTASELSADLNLGSIRIDGLLYQMAQRGFVVRQARPDRANGYRFGVTMACKAPFGLTLHEVAKAIGVLQPTQTAEAAAQGPAHAAQGYVPRTQWQGARMALGSPA